MDSNETVSLVRYDDDDTVSDVESATKNMPVTEDQEAIPNDEFEPQEEMFFGGIWWDSSWAEDMNLYDDHEYWRFEEEVIMEEEDPEEENPEEGPEEEDPEEDREEEDFKGGDSAGVSKDESFTDSNITS